MIRNLEHQLLFVATSASIFCCIAANYFLPALPSLAEHLNVSVAWGQTLLTMLLVGVIISNCLATFLVRFLSIKHIIWVFLSIYFFGVLLSYFADVYWMLALGFLIQGTGYGSLLALTQSQLVKSKSKQLTRKIAIILFLSPIFIPITTSITGYADHHFGYSTVFYVIFAIALLFLFVSFTMSSQHKSTVQKGTLTSILSLLKSTEYLKNVVPLALIGAGSAVFYASSPFIIIHEFHISSKIFGLMLFIPIVGLMLGRMMGIVLVKCSSSTMIYSGFVVALVSALLMMFIPYDGMLEAVILMLSMGGYMFGFGMVGPTAESDSLVVDRTISAIASTVVTIIFNVACALQVSITAHFFEGLLAETLVVLTILALVFYTAFNMLKVKKG